MSECRKCSLCPLTAVNANFVSYTFSQNLMTKPELKSLFREHPDKWALLRPWMTPLSESEVLQYPGVNKANWKFTRCWINQGPRQE